jgi:hypothetical protein
MSKFWRQLMKMEAAASSAVSVTIDQYKTPSTSADIKVKFTLEQAMKAQRGVEV